MKMLVRNKHKTDGGQNVKIETKQKNGNYTNQLNYQEGQTFLFYDICSDLSGGNVTMFIKQ